MLSFASDERAACFWAFYYEENVSREQESFFDACGDFLKRKSHHQERERGKGKKAKKQGYSIESSIRWNEREMRRMARVVAKKEWMFLFLTLY